MSKDGISRRKFIKAAGSASMIILGAGVPGCISSGAKDTIKGVNRTYTITNSVKAKFAEYKPLPVSATPSIADYRVSSLSAIEGIDDLGLSEPAKKLLSGNLFVAKKSAYAQIYDAYKRYRDSGTPAFVTSDSVLHAYHILFDYTLREIEMAKLIPAAIEMTDLLFAESLSQMNSGIAELASPTSKNVAFFAVARYLLTGKWDTVPAGAKSLAEAEIRLIEAHEGFAESPVFGIIEDYSQYVPRGHYDRNDSFKKYFKAMMWYGRIPFGLYKETITGIEPDKDRIRQAIMITLALKERSLELWKLIYDPTVFFVGKTDDLSVYDFSPLLKQTYGDSISLADLKDDAKINSFIESADALESPKIISGFIKDIDDKKLLKGFRLMGQRFIPDSYIFQGLVYDKVGTQDDPRKFPMGLDVMAVLGSNRAYEILDTIYRETRYLNYQKQFDLLKSEFAALDAAMWTQNLYWCWLYSLLPLLNEKGTGYPSFMKSQAWVDKDLNASLGSWAELRHDTILYAKQSYSVFATGMPVEEAIKGYVEPNPEVYGRLAALAKMTVDGLESRGLLEGEFKEKLKGLNDLLVSLKSISEKELSGTILSDTEYNLIKGIGDSLQNLTTFSDDTSADITNETDKKMAVIADVHTDSNTGQVLEVGVGNPYELIVIVPIEGKLTLAHGVTFSYYEFKQPMADRLTDEKWQEKLASETAPKPQEWTNSFLA